MQKKDGTCYLCKLLHDDYSEKYTEEHHVFGGWANRDLSERYGLKVYLCIYHHREGKEAVHNNHELMMRLKALGQQSFEQHYQENFREIFGKNYKEEDMNKAFFMGRLCKDPEVRHTAEGKVIARFSLAVDRKFKKEGEPEADFFNMTSFGKQAEFVEKYLRKGSKILVEGEIRNDTYTNKEGQKVYATQVITSAIEFAESKRDGAQTPTPSTAGDGFMSIPDGIDEELPFT